MSVQKIFASVLMIFILGFFFFHITYNKVDTQKFIAYNLEKPTLGTYQADGNGEFKFIPKAQSFSGNIFKEVLSWQDSVYYAVNDAKGYKKTSQNTTTRIEIGTGLYFFDILDMSQKYEIVHNGFAIEIHSPGQFYIDSTQSNIRIFSFDGVFDVILLSAKAEITRATLYPHMSFLFNPSRNTFLKNADLSRLDSVFAFSYLNGLDLIDIPQTVQNIQKSLYWGKTDDRSTRFLSQVFTKVSQKHDGTKNVQSFLLADNLEGLYGMDLIQKYGALFYNDAKKTVFLKNKILSQLNAVLEKNVQEVPMSDIEVNLTSLQELSQKDFDEMKDIVSYYYKNTLNYSEGDDIEKIFFFADILSFMNGTEKISKEVQSTFYLNNIYTQLHKGIIKKSEVYERLSEYMQFVFRENNITYDQKTHLLKKPQNTQFNMEYIAFFFKNILSSDVKLENEKTLQDFTELLGLYYALNTTLSLEKKWQHTETIILEYDVFLQNILTQIRKDFFEDAKNDVGLLVLKNNYNKISTKTFLEFDKKVALLFQFYQDNRAYITEKNKTLDLSFARYKLMYQEYFLALSDYKNYVLTYDITKKILIDTKTIDQWGQNLVLDENYIRTYLAQFSGIDLSNVKTSLENNEYYKISNLKVQDKIISFELYPKLLHRMDKIVVNGRSLNNIYDLDTLKESFEALAENTSLWPNDLPPKKFQDFFVFTFVASGTTSQRPTDQIEDLPQISQREDGTIIVFKRDTLLWQNWEFKALKWYAQILYNDLEVTLKDGAYNIFIKKGTIVKKDINTSTTIIFSSPYVFTNQLHYFKMPTFQFYTGEKWDQRLFNGMSLQVQKNINILDFSSETQKIFDLLLKNAGIYNRISDSLGVAATMRYTANDVLIFTFSYKNTTHNVSLKPESETFLVDNTLMRVVDFENFLKNLK